MAKRWTFGALHERGAKEGILQGRALQVVFGQDGATWQVRVRGWLPAHLRHLLETRNQVGTLPEPAFTDLAEHMAFLGAPYARYGAAGREVIEAQGRSAVALWEWLYRYLDAADAQALLSLAE